MPRLRSIPTGPFPVADRRDDGTPVVNRHPRLRAIQQLHKWVADGRAGLHPRDHGIFYLDALPHERFQAEVALTETGLIVSTQRSDRGVRFLAILEADVRLDLGLDHAAGQLRLRGVESPVMEAIADAREAYDRRYPHGITKEDTHA